MKLEAWQLAQRQSLPLEIKIEMSKQRIRQWYDHWGGDVYVAFSGGKDSTVLLHLVRSMYPQVPAVFNVGLEYPEIVKFVRTVDNVVWLHPEMSFDEVIAKYGYPVISKEISQAVKDIRTSKSEKTRNRRLKKLPKKWKFLLEAPFKISDRCCDIIKKNPAKKFERRTGLKPFLGELACESFGRRTRYLMYGCNQFDSSRPTSRPIAFWLEQDILEYIRRFNLSIASIYGSLEVRGGNLKLTGLTRTGCFPCMFGVHLEKGVNKFQRMQVSHPSLWKYCMFKLNMAEVLSYLGIPYEYDYLFPLQLNC